MGRGAAALLALLLLYLAPASGGRRKNRKLAAGRSKDEGTLAAAECTNLAWEPPAQAETDELDLGDRCDWDRVDTAPSDEEFLENYWQKKPLVIRNYTTQWPAHSRWYKDQLLERYGDRNVTFFDSDSNQVSHAKWIPTTMGTFVRENVCDGDAPLSAERALHKEYLFDRDGLFNSVPELMADYDHPSFISQFFDPELHERFSRYFLVGSRMSGINYHSHTDAYNGLVHGRKRWLVYSHHAMPQPPFREYGTLRWVREVLGNLPAGQRPLECMQSEGDLIYVPEGYWHATVNLGETVGVSGQFVRNTGKWGQQVQKALGEGDYATAEVFLKKMLSLPGPHDKEARFNLALALTHVPGRLDDAEEATRDLRTRWGIGGTSYGPHIGGAEVSTALSQTCPICTR
jgi:hypothetical protein